VQVPVVYGLADGDHRLGEQQPAEETLGAGARASAEDVRADLFEIEAANQAGERIRRLYVVETSPRSD
jgi:predicted outer membrane protein